MAGNSSRRGAIRKGGSKKGAVVGSGGQRRKGLEGRGPTPKASDRPGHPAARRAKRAEAARPSAARRQQSNAAEALAGRNAVVEALRARVPATALHVQVDVDPDDRVREATSLAGDRGLSIIQSTRAELDRMTGRAVHQGLVLSVPAYDYAEAADLIASGVPLVALDGVTDPRNLGAVARSAAAFGFGGIIVPERRAAGVTASAWKASAGALARIPVARVTNLTRALKQAASDGYTVLGLDADGSVDLPALDPVLASGAVLVVVGGEDAGMSRLVRETCDVVVSIPMAAGNESLNAGVAAGIALYTLNGLRNPPR
jgi:23S rRNA (guanosine2251-2'-O)-methyltransferase